MQGGPPLGAYGPGAPHGAYGPPQIPQAGPGASVDSVIAAASAAARINAQLVAKGLGTKVRSLLKLHTTYMLVKP